MATIAPGQKAPEFTLKDQNQNEVSLSSLRGQTVVLAFYPLDFSPVCSKEHGCFKEDASKLSSANAQVLGISVDHHWAHHAFAKSLGIDYPLLADFHPKGAVATQYGLFQADKGFTSRATVIIDDQGKVAFTQEHGLGEARNDETILEALKKLG